MGLDWRTCRQVGCIPCTTYNVGNGNGINYEIGETLGSDRCAKKRNRVGPRIYVLKPGRPSFDPAL